MSNRFRVSNILADRLTEHGIALGAVLQRASLSADLFQQERVYLTTDELFALWRAVGETSGDPCIGLKLGTEERVERFNAAALTALCSQSFRDALQRLARYKQITCPEMIRIEQQGNEAAVEFVFLEADQEEPGTLVDLCLSWIFSIGRRGTEGQVRPVRLELTRPLQHRETLEAHFGCRVRFHAARNAIIFRASDLDRSFVTHNADLLKVVGEQMETEFREWKAGASVGDQVKQTLKRSLAGKRPVLGDIARQLGMSVRTLQRRLTEAGVSFQQVVEDTRRELAHHYLRQSTVELTEAAHLLGYEDTNSFFRAFQLWEGTSPGQWRSLNATRD